MGLGGDWGRRVRRGWQIASVGFLALFLFSIWKAASLPLRDALGPGPGFFPLWLGIVGSLLAVLLLLEARRARSLASSDDTFMPASDAALRIVFVLVALAAAAFLFERIGYRFTVIAFALALLPALGIRSVTAIVVFALATSLGVFHVFYHWLKVPLPIGPYDHVFKLIGL